MSRNVSKSATAQTDAVSETLAAFYAGSADQLLTLGHADGGQYLDIERTAARTDGPRYSLRASPEPPFLRLG